MTKQPILTRTSVFITTLGGILMVLGGKMSIASTFAPSPIYAEARSYMTTIPTTGSKTGFDEADIYFPVADDPTITFPIALMLQGALVERLDYSNFASEVARYGFAVVVPSHERTLFGPMGPITGFFPDAELVTDVLDFMEVENLNDLSPIEGKVDTTKMGLLGHSFGAAVGVTAIDGNCFPILCNGFYTRPPELIAGIFYGANTFNSLTQQFIPIDNQGIPIGLIAGDRDGVALLPTTLGTYSQIQAPPKILVTVQGANHYGITDEDSLRDPIRPASDLEQSVATETIARWSALFLQAHVQDNVGAFDYVYNTGDAQDEKVKVVSTEVPEPSAILGTLILGIGSAVLRLRNQKKN